MAQNPKLKIAALAALEHVPKKLIGFFDQNMLQLSEFERFLFDQMSPSDREALKRPLAKPASASNTMVSFR
jgi:hypothetical protein